MLVETDLQNFLNPSSFVFVFVTDGCVERVVDVLVEEEEVVKEHDQQPSCDQDSVQVLLHKIHSLPSLGNAYGNGVQARVLFCLYNESAHGAHDLFKVSNHTLPFI